jgi:hypothetical protein
MAKPSEIHPDAEAVDEAIRTLTEASSASAASAQRALANSRSIVSDTIGVNRKLLATFSTGVEATFKAGFEVQSALFAAAPPLLDSGLSATKSLLEAWKAVAEQQQSAVLKGWQRTTQILDKVAAPPA